MPPSPESGLQAAALLLQGLGGAVWPVRALPAPAPDTPEPRTILSTEQLLLPPALLGTPAQALRAAAVAHAAAHLRYSPVAQPTDTLKPLGLAVVSAFEDARVEALLMQGWPGVRAWFLAGLRASLRPDALDAAGLLSRLDLALLDAGYADGNHWIQKGRTLFAQVRVDHGLDDPAPFRRAAAILANDLGQMRVRFDARRHSVPGLYRDDHSYLWDHAHSADLARTVEAPTPPARTGGTAACATPAEQAPLPYPEWNYRSGVLRPDWCLLHESAPPLAASTVPASAVRRLPPLRPRGMHGPRLRHQPEGEELDLDAAVAARLAQRLRLDQDDRIYQRPGPRPQHLSLLLLLDLSQSTADLAPGGQCSLLALAQQAALLLAPAAHATGDRVAVHGFSSDTRERVHYHRLLDFGGPLDDAAQQRLRRVQPRYSTRLGTALRHASTLLARERKVSRRVLLVLTDGLPSDIDVHDPRYLHEDARHAVRTATHLGVAVHALTVNAAAASEAMRIFGRQRCQVLHRAEQLPRQLLTLYARVSAG